MKHGPRIKTDGQIGGTKVTPTRAPNALGTLFQIIKDYSNSLEARFRFWEIFILDLYFTPFINIHFGGANRLKDENNITMRKILSKIFIQ